MLDLSQVPMDAPLPFIALAVLYNLIRHAINLYHERKQNRGDEEINERLIHLSSQLAEARLEIKFLREKLEKKGA